MKEKAPAFQWYPGDFRRDTAVQACSFEARALWREMIDLMHDGSPRGYLTAGGVPISPAELARIVGMPHPRVKRWLSELEQRNVFSRNEDGIIYSRRMVKDEHNRAARAAGGVRSLDHPNVPQPKNGRIPSDDPSLGPSGGPLDHPLQLQSATASAENHTAPAAREPFAIEREERLFALLAEHTDVLRWFLETRPAEARDPWVGRLHSVLEKPPHYTPRELGEALEDIRIKSARVDSPLFVRKCCQLIREEHQRQQEANVPPSERNGRAPRSILSASDAYVDKILALVQQSEVSGSGVREFIPKKEVWNLGPPIAAAYDAVGGFDAFIAAKRDPAKLHFLRRDFAEAFARAMSVKAQPVGGADAPTH